MTAARKKLKVATTSLAGCFGCHMSFLDIDERLFELIRQAQVRVFYVRLPAHFGVLNPDAKDPPELGSAD